MFYELRFYRRGSDEPIDTIHYYDNLDRATSYLKQLAVIKGADCAGITDPKSGAIMFRVGKSEPVGPIEVTPAAKPGSSQIHRRR